MTKARRSIVNIDDTPYYHCMGRCVRRAFICGVDKLTGRDYSHRKQWIVDKLAELSHAFLIDVCAYAVMSNHYHVVLKVNHTQTQNLNDDEVIERWMSLYSGNILVNRYIKNECKTDTEIGKAKEIIKQWRERLADLSWFMRNLNEYISRKANEEDKCTGHFWEGRFKSQALLNDHALLSCMAYVDLNPIRAGLADSLDTSEFTSIEQRIREVESERLKVETQEQNIDGRQPSVVSQKKVDAKAIRLADFVGGLDKEGIPYRLMDYLELAGWTGRAILPHKKGKISEDTPKILDKLGFTTEIWLNSVKQFSDHLYSHIGSPEQLRKVCENHEQKWIAGIQKSRQFYSS